MLINTEFVSSRLCCWSSLIELILCSSDSKCALKVNLSAKHVLDSLADDASAASQLKASFLPHVFAKLHINYPHLTDGVAGVRASALIVQGQRLADLANKMQKLLRAGEICHTLIRALHICLQLL